jgi:hypothetical protein
LAASSLVRRASRARRHGVPVVRQDTEVARRLGRLTELKVCSRRTGDVQPLFVALAPAKGTRVVLLALAMCPATAAAATAANGSDVLRPAGAGRAPSTDPYAASLAYASCLRRRGVPHPNPDRKGNFDLTPAQERRLRSVQPRARRAAENACFHHLTGLDLRPLSPKAIARAKGVLEDLRECLRAKGFVAGAPVVRNLGRGKAFFGLSSLPNQGRSYWRSRAGTQHQRASRRCEREIDMGRRISAIVEEERRTGDL